MNEAKRSWWKEAVVYQIYPRSFMDSNGDGIGDLPGIVSKVDYLKRLGVDVVWLSPVYKSPNADNGYDISDYCDIMDEFGTLADWDALRDALHERGIRLVMDLVVNHSSDEHPWFVESRKSRDNPKSDWYIWRDGTTRANGTRMPPATQWTSFFSGSVWKYCAERDQFYLHLFAEKQPDLNWENPDVRAAIYRSMKFWLDRGIDGFRMDVANMYSKDPAFTVFLNGPRIHEFMQEMNREVLSKYDIMTVGEMPGVDPETAALYVGEDRHEVNMLFQFEHMDLDSGPGGKFDIKPWKLSALKRVLGKWQSELDGKGWNSLYLNNHDQPRMVSRFGNDALYRKESAKMLATMIHTMQGTPYVYQGEELGMTNVCFPRLSDYEDIEIRNYAKDAMERDGLTEAELLPRIHYKGRDNARTPMQWTAGPQAGFTTGKPWLGVNPNHSSINAVEALADDSSVFHYYRKLIELRHAHPIIPYGGNFTDLCPESETTYAYTRELDGTKLYVALNFTGENQAVPRPADFPANPGRPLIANYPTVDGLYPNAPLRPYEARVWLY
jgi:oligo-1,6-glucosidase